MKLLPSLLSNEFVVSRNTQLLRLGWRLISLARSGALLTIVRGYSVTVSTANFAFLRFFKGGCDASGTANKNLLIPIDVVEVQSRRMGLVSTVATPTFKFERIKRRPECFVPNVFLTEMFAWIFHPITLAVDCSQFWMSLVSGSTFSPRLLDVLVVPSTSEFEMMSRIGGSPFTVVLPKVFPSLCLLIFSHINIIRQMLTGINAINQSGEAALA